MKSSIKTAIRTTLATLVGGVLLSSCSADTPFGGDDEGTLKLQMVVNSEITRAEISDADYLRSNCVVYISNEKGLLHKFKGIENVPSEIKLKSGNYVAEAWTGDSVSASFDKKFYRGYEPFSIQNGTTSVVVACHISNVVASINHSTIDPEVMKDWKVTVGHSRGSLDITEDNQSEKAYFMMPSVDTDLTYTVSGTRADGKPFSKEGVISNVKPAHEYVMNFTYTPDDSQIGGAFITIIIDDQAIEEVADVPIYGRPSIAGEGYDIDAQRVGDAGGFEESIVKISAFGGLRSLSLSSDDWSALGLPASELDLLNLTGTPTTQLNNLGVTWDISHKSDKNLSVAFLHFGASFMNRLAERPTEYRLQISAEDIYGKSNTATLRIAVGEDAIIIDDPVTAIAPDPTDQMAVLSTRATLYATLNDANAENAAIEYRVAGTQTWSSTPLATRSGRRAAGIKMKATLTGLLPATRYEYRAVAKDFAGESMYFTTESRFEIPNSSMEAWAGFVDKAETMIPSADGTSTFWDSGNHGSILTGVNLTQPTTEIFHSGSRAARLRSQKCTIMGAGKFAAGNLFTGSFDGLDGTDGKLTFGRQYDSSHPDKLKLWVNYRPGTVASNSDYFSAGDLDQAQIYVALTTEPIEIRTKKSNRKLFDPTADVVVAYGEKTFTSNFGAEGTLEQIEIPLNYYPSAASKRPLYLVIVCSASKYGDYFTGGEGSLMIVDDFELIYE